MKPPSKWNNKKKYGKIYTACRCFIGLFEVLSLKKNRSNIFKAIFTFLSSCLIIDIFCSAIALYMPYSTAEAYTECLNHKDYDKALKYYVDIPEGIMTNTAGIRAALRNEYENTSKIKIDSVTPALKLGVYDAKITITKNGQTYVGSFSLLKSNTGSSGLKSEWRVLFPFKVKDVRISGPDGSWVYVDGIYAGVIQNGILDISGVICGSHDFTASIPYMAKSETLSMEVNEENHDLEIKLKPVEGFRKDMERLISDFCDGWSEYCMSRNPQCIRPYLSSGLFNEYANDPDIFCGSKYEECRYAIDFKEFEIKSRDSIRCRVDEKWHIREIVIVPGLMFKANGKTSLEQDQYITWDYNIMFQSGSWKIDSTEQISFRQEIEE